MLHHDSVHLPYIFLCVSLFSRRTAKELLFFISFVVMAKTGSIKDKIICVLSLRF